MMDSEHALVDRLEIVYVCDTIFEGLSRALSKSRSLLMKQEKSNSMQNVKSKVFNKSSTYQNN